MKKCTKQAVSRLLGFDFVANLHILKKNFTLVLSSHL